MALKIRRKLDWLQLTWRGREKPESVLPQIECFDGVDYAKPTGNYDTAYKLACGGYFCHSDDLVQGIMLTLTGAPLKAVREAGFSDLQLIELAMTANNVPRLDYALDIMGNDGPKHSPELLEKAYRKKMIKTRLGLDSHYKDEKTENGYTFCWGSKKSDQRVIVYDKATQMNILWQAWTRIELRLRDDYAKALAFDMDKIGVEIAGDSKLKKVFNPQVKWFQDALSKGLVDPSEVPNKESNFPKWLHSTVLASIKKNGHAYKNEIWGFLQEATEIMEGLG